MAFMRLSCVFVLCVLLHGCAGYYRTVNHFMGVGDTFRMLGKEMVGSGERPLFPEIADFTEVGCVDGSPVYEATFRPRKPRDYCFVLEYEQTKRIDGRLLKNLELQYKIEYETMCVDTTVEIELYHKGRLGRRWKREIGKWPGVKKVNSELVRVKHDVGCVRISAVPWRASDELTVRIAARGEGVRELLKRNGSRLFIYEYNAVD